MLSFLEVSKDGSVNVSRLRGVPHRTAGSGGFVDITSRARKIVFSGNFNVGAKVGIKDGCLIIHKEGIAAKFVDEVDQVTFSGLRATEQGQDVTYVTERCVIRLLNGKLVVTEIAPGIDLQRDILNQATTSMIVSDNLKTMDANLFYPKLMQLSLVKA